MTSFDQVSRIPAYKAMFRKTVLDLSKAVINVIDSLPLSNNILESLSIAIGAFDAFRDLYFDDIPDHSSATIMNTLEHNRRELELLDYLYNIESAM